MCRFLQLTLSLLFSCQFLTIQAQSPNRLLKANDQNYSLYLTGGDGNNSHVDISGLNLNSLPYTIEMLIKSDAQQTANAGLIFNRPGNVGLQYTSGWQSTSQSLRYMANGGDTYGQGTETADIQEGKWHHIAVVMTSTSRTLYIDGIGKTENATFTGENFSSGKTYLGWDSDVSNRAFKGWIDEVRIWSEARTETQLMSNASSVLDPSEESNLIAYWNFDDQAQNATDLAGENHGAINGGTYDLSDWNAPMEYMNSTVVRSSEFADLGKKATVGILKINTKNQSNPLSLTSLRLTTTGTTDVGDIEDIIISWSADASSGNMIEWASLGGSPGDDEITLSGDLSLKEGENYFFIRYQISKEAAVENELDVSVVSFDLTQESITETHIPEITSPDGKVTVNPSAFSQLIRQPQDTVTTLAETTNGGANFVSFQQDALMTYNGYQYVTYWNDEQNNGQIKVAIARKKLPYGYWEIMELDDHVISPARQADNHYNISMGICPNDGTIHITYDHHNDVFHYQRSVVGLANRPEDFAWADESFGEKIDYLSNSDSTISNVTYPRFVRKPNGDMLLEMRIGWSGDGNSYLWEYSGSDQNWDYIGEYVNGTSVNENAYINGIHYDPIGRLHVSWVWRQTPDAQTNHDISYAYSDDDGRTWYNNAGQHVANTRRSDSNPVPLTRDTDGLVVVPISTYRGLINQESQAVDSKSKIHILQSYINESKPNASNFWDARVNDGELRHIYKDKNGDWKSDLIAMTDGGNRSEIAVDSMDNLYVVAWDYRVYFASAAGEWKDWIPLDIAGQGMAQNEPIIDRQMLMEHNVLSFAYAHADNDGKVMVSYHAETNDPSLRNIRINGNLIQGFDPMDLDQYFVLPSGESNVPSIEPIPFQNEVDVTMTDITEVPGTVEITATTSDGLSKIYQLNILTTTTDDASLIDLTIDGETIKDFEPGILNYTITLPESTIDIPLVDAVVKNSKATSQIFQSAELPGGALVIVTAEDGQTKSNYNVYFELEEEQQEILQVSDNQLLVYPNPVQDHLILEGVRGLKEMNVYTMSGQKVKRFELNEEQTKRVNFENLPKGLLILEIINNEGDVEQLKVLKK